MLEVGSQLIFRMASEGVEVPAVLATTESIPMELEETLVSSGASSGEDAPSDGVVEETPGESGEKKTKKKKSHSGPPYRVSSRRLISALGDWYKKSEYTGPIEFPSYDELTTVLDNLAKELAKTACPREPKVSKTDTSGPRRICLARRLKKFAVEASEATGRIIPDGYDTLSKWIELYGLTALRDSRTIGSMLKAKLKKHKLPVFENPHVKPNVFLASDLRLLTPEDGCFEGVLPESIPNPYNLPI